MPPPMTRRMRLFASTRSHPSEGEGRQQDHDEPERHRDPAENARRRMAHPLDALAFKREADISRSLELGEQPFRAFRDFRQIAEHAGEGLDPPPGLLDAADRPELALDPGAHY